MVAVVEIRVKTCRQKHTSCHTDAAETAATTTFLFHFMRRCFGKCRAIVVCKHVAMLQTQTGIDMMQNLQKNK